ncbi:hypothetical protein NDU88_011652 [Pleurodeles waltl]|uniref:Uncharacterized protein n=1 Tax=Pleurodeles waltl TaxID=8319 RepID=A0AAV7R3M2_PLEWA|nr:hypothetical protein NDU88_011652 [Pleurodeles waltl]
MPQEITSRRHQLTGAHKEHPGPSARWLRSVRPHSMEGSLRSPSLPRSCPTQMKLESSYDPYAYETVTQSFSSRSANLSSGKIHFPGLNSTRDFEKLLQRNRRFVSLGKVQKLDVVDLDDCSLSGYGNGSNFNKLSVVWVPESKKCQRQRCQEGNRSQQILRIGVKELTVQIPEPSDFNNLSVCRTNRKNRKNSKKIPSGGQPYGLSMAVIHPNHPYTRSLPEKLPSSNMKTKVKQSFSTEGGSSEDPLVQRGSTCRQSFDKTTAIQGPNSPLLDNRKMILHQVKERHSHTCPVPNGSPRYKMDEKPSRVFRGSEIDLESIKNQPYLWKKYIDGAGPNGKIKVSGYCPNNKMQPERSFGFLGGLGLFPSPGSTSRSCQKTHFVEPPDGSTTSKEEESSFGSRTVSSGLTPVSGESKPVPALETPLMFGKEMSLNTDMLSDFSEEKNLTGHLTEPVEEKDNVNPEADLNGGERTETPEQRTEVWNDDSDKPGKGQETGEYPESPAKPSNVLDDCKQKKQLNNNKMLEGDKINLRSNFLRHPEIRSHELLLQTEELKLGWLHAEETTG